MADSRAPVSFPELEDETLRFWSRHRVFEQSVSRRDGRDKFVFYDGPPFATGLPHYGHILTSYIKDTVPRYFTMRGYHVPRRWGWDCHGLPVEYEVEKELGTRSKREILDYGIGNFNRKCGELVLRYAEEWRRFVTRMGRWVDFDGAYRTMDRSFIESVLWAFESLHKNGFVYEGRKVVPYCTRCQTVLSNFEARLDDAYRLKQSISLFVKFHSAGDDDVSYLAWTTTPWTLPANALLAVSADDWYVLIQTGGGRIWLAEQALPRLRGKLADGVIVDRRPGKDLAGERYLPLFPFSTQSEDAYRIRTADFVDIAEGTGFVHVAPAFGEDDFLLGAQCGVEGFNPVRDDGTFDETAGPYADQPVQTAAGQIAERLFQEGKALEPEQIRHNYPHCWRCDNPLIYRAVTTWFVSVSSYRERLVELNQRVQWVPSHIRDGRFGDWLANARDWAVSRSRFWGAPIPVWRCESCSHYDVVGSVGEIERRSGKAVTSLHRPAIDEHVFECPKCSGPMHRVPDVFDCWFESGSMPFASRHYPFEHQEEFEKDFPADFIVEYVAQTRGWFYTLFAVSGGVLDSEPFRSAVCHGVILGKDGRKMSKRLKNYPDPLGLLSIHGSDALRAALLMSPVCKGEDIRFSEEAVRDVVRRFHLLTWNCLQFYRTFSEIDGFRPDRVQPATAELPIDAYLLHELERLREGIDAAMTDFDFFGAYTAIERFINRLSTWYIKLNKSRIWREGLDGDKQDCYQVLWASLKGLALLAAPFLPFLSESMWQALGEEGSVHLQDWPAPDPALIKPSLAEEMDCLQQLVSAARSIRDKNNSSLKVPLREMRIAGVAPWIIERNRALLLEELNVKDVSIVDDVSDWVQDRIMVDLPELARTRPQVVKDVKASVARTGLQVNADGTATTGEFVLSPQEFQVTAIARPDVRSVAVAGKLVVWLDLSVDEALILEADAREINRRLQDLRKKAGLAYVQRIRVFISPSDYAARILDAHSGYLKGQLLAVDIALTSPPNGAPVVEIPLRNGKVIAGFEAVAGIPVT